MVEKRSTFISVMAWMGIVSGGVGSVIGFLQFYLAGRLMEEFENLPQDSRNFVGQELPNVFHTVMDNPEIVFLFTTSLFVLLFVSSIGFLRRKNWARLLYILQFIVAGLWSVYSLLFLTDMLTPLHTSNLGNFSNLFENIKVFSYSLIVVQIVLIAWVLYKLVTPKIKQEFL